MNDVPPRSISSAEASRPSTSPTAACTSASRSAALDTGRVDVLLPRVVGNDEQQPIERQLVARVDREDEMTDVWWVERSAEHAEALTQRGEPP